MIIFLRKIPFSSLLYCSPAERIQPLISLSFLLQHVSYCYSLHFSSASKFNSLLGLFLPWDMKSECVAKLSEKVLFFVLPCKAMCAFLRVLFIAMGCENRAQTGCLHPMSHFFFFLVGVVISTELFGHEQGESENIKFQYAAFAWFWCEICGGNSCVG